MEPEGTSMKQIIGLALCAFSSLCGAQTTPPFMGTSHILETPLTRFPDAVGIRILLDADNGAISTSVRVGCQSGAEDVVWSTLAFGGQAECLRQGGDNLRVFVHVDKCNKSPIHLELHPRQVDTAWTEDGQYRGTVTLLLRARSLNYRNVVKPPKAPPPFSVLKNCT
jgi:hypothetical protein